MRFPIFAKAIEKCDAVLKPRKINIYDILTKKDNSVLDNILHSFVGIAAVQVNSTNIFFSFIFLPICMRLARTIRRCRNMNHTDRLGESFKYGGRNTGLHNRTFLW